MVGIPQGSVLSSLLCSIFYADLERTRLNFTQDPMSVCASFLSLNSRVIYRQLLLRLIDDYLFITTDQAKARKFLDLMIKGLETPLLSYFEASDRLQDIPNLVVSSHQKKL